MIYQEDKQIIIPFLIKLLKTGKYSSTQIVANFYKSPVSRMYKYSFNDSKIRELVNYIRRNQIEPLLSNRTGYWISYDIVEIYESYNDLSNRIEKMEDACQGLKKIMTKINKNKNK